MSSYLHDQPFVRQVELDARSRGQIIRGIKVFRNKSGEACDVTQPFVRQVE